MLTLDVSKLINGISSTGTTSDETGLDIILGFAGFLTGWFSSKSFWTLLLLISMGLGGGSSIVVCDLRLTEVIGVGLLIENGC